MRATSAFAFAIVLACLVGACDKRAPSAAPNPAPSASTVASIAPSASSTTSAQPAFEQCGPLDCRAYDDLATAFDAVLDREKPLVMAVGEAHAKKGLESIDDAAKRFTTEIVPRLAGRTSDLLLELMSPGQGCDQANKATGKELGKIAVNQAPEAPNEYVVLGKTAEKLGIRVSQLHPTCKELAEIAKSKSPPLAVLQLITTLTKRDVIPELNSPTHPKDKLFVIYGGAFHGEPDPPPERAEFSFAADLSKAAQGRYVSVHLFVREYIDASWDIWPWYPHFRPEAHPDKVTVFHPKPQHYVIITQSPEP